MKQIADNKIKNKRDQGAEKYHKRVTDHSTPKIKTGFRPEVQIANRAKFVHITDVLQTIGIGNFEHLSISATRAFHFK